MRIVASSTADSLPPCEVHPTPSRSCSRLPTSTPLGTTVFPASSGTECALRWPTEGSWGRHAIEAVLARARYDTAAPPGYSARTLVPRGVTRPEQPEGGEGRGRALRAQRTTGAHLRAFFVLRRPLERVLVDTQRRPWRAVRELRPPCLDLHFFSSPAARRGHDRQGDRPAGMARHLPAPAFGPAFTARGFSSRNPPVVPR